MKLFVLPFPKFQILTPLLSIMRQIFFISVLTLVLGMTGCQPKGPEPTVEPPAGKPDSEVSIPEAVDAIKLIKKRGGEFSLTPSGTVSKIVVDSSDLDEAAFDLFAQQPELETLMIANFRDLNDEMVKKLIGLKNLRSLQLKNSSISDAAVKTIVESFPDLVKLDISSNTRLKDVSLKEIAKLKNLEELVVNYCDFSEFGMMSISSLPKLKSLDIRANMQVGNGGLRYLTQLPALKALKHRSPAVDDAGLESLTAAKGLETLEIQDFNVTDRAGEFIGQFENLTNLIVFRCQGFGSSGAAKLKGMKLNRLTLRDLPSLDDTGMEVFRELVELKRLYLNELASVSDTGILNLVYLKDLDTLDIWEVPITDKSLETIAKLANLKTLSIRATQITDAAADLLISMPKLENLTLKENGKITPVTFKKLQDSKKFKKLDFGTSNQKEDI
jgi:Leucine-rich repeat (LRR) protein